MESNLTLAERTRRRLDRVDDVPTLPPVLLMVWELTGRSDSSAADLARAIGSDPGLTGAVLRLANSAYFGFPRKIGTVKQAIVVLGFDTVRSLATGASVMRALGPSSPSGMDAGEFLRHSMVTAMAARLLVERRWRELAGSAFCGGVLHDLGKLVIAEYLAEANAEIGSRVAGGALREDAERETLGMTHAEIGGWFADRWSLPEELAAAVRWHHDPAGAGDRERFAAAVHVGDVLAHRVGAGGSGRTEPPALRPEACTILGLPADELGEWTERVAALTVEMPSAEAALGLGAK
ncbi:MAG: HDOD domain-containing protein [bacterium]